jgi:WD40 repeat protein
MLGLARVWGSGRAQGDRWPRAVFTIAALSAIAVACGKTTRPEAVSSSGAAGSSGMASGNGGAGSSAGVAGGSSTGGASGAGGAATAGTGVGVTLGGAPPFSLPVTSLPELEPCESLTVPEPFGFLADGRPLVLHRLRPFNGAPAGDLLRAWDPTTRALETVVVTEQGARLLLSNFGRLFELSSLGAREPGYRTHQLGAGSVSSSPFIPVEVLATSGIGLFVLDQSLRRLTAEGEPDFDFAPLLSEPALAQARYAAMSYTGNAIAVPWRDGAEAWSVELVNTDGRSLQLAEAPPLEHCCNASDLFSCPCSISFSRDGRHVLGVGSGQLRVWETGSGTVVLRADGSEIQHASLVPDTPRVVAASGSAVFEYSIVGSERSPVPLDRPSFAVGANATLGYLDGDLVVVERDQVRHSWRQPAQDWPSAVAVKDDAAFAIVHDRDFDAPFPLMVARYEPNVAGPTALFRPQESQSEWVGQITLSPEGERVAVVLPDTVRVLDGTTLELLVTLPTGAGTIAWSPDGRYLVTSPDLHYRDFGRRAYELRKTLDFWDAATGQLAASYATPVHTQAFAFSADGTKIVASGQEMKERPNADFSPSSVTSFFSHGEVRSFALDVSTGGISDSALGRIIGSTREVVATERGLFRVSTEEPISLFVSPDAADPPLQVVLAPDASIGLILRDSLSPGELFVVADAEKKSQAPVSGRGASLAISPGGHRVAIGEGIYCAAHVP